MLILLEGPDGAGKTTLANAIADRVPGTRIIKKNKPELPALVEYTADLATYRAGAGASVIGDRWHLGERVYGPLYRGGCELSPVMWAAVEAFLYQRGAFFVIVVAEPQTLYDRLTKRGEEPNFRQLREETEAFYRSVTWTRLAGRTFVTDGEFAKNSYNEAVTALVELARREEQRAVEDA